MLQLMLEQPRFSPQVAAVAHQFSVTSDHAVAGQDDGDRVTAVGSAHCAGGFEVAVASRYFQVGSSGSVRNVEQ